MALDPENLPFLQLWLDDWFGSPTVATMPPLVELLYLRAIARQYQRGHLPAKADDIRRLVLWDPQPFAEAWPEIERLFPVDGDGMRRNAACERKRASYLKKALAGSRGGVGKQPRKQTPKQNGSDGGSERPTSHPHPQSHPLPQAETGALCEGSESAPAVQPKRPRRWARDETFPASLAPWAPGLDEWLEARRSNRGAKWAKGGFLLATAARGVVRDLLRVPDELRAPLLTDAAENAWLGLRRAIDQGDWLTKNAHRAQKDDRDDADEARRRSLEIADAMPVHDSSGSAPPGRAAG